MTSEILRSIFIYHRDGYLIWKTSGKRRVVGKIAGCVGAGGRRVIMVNGKLYTAYRLIYIYHYNTLPRYIDHINRDCSDDRIENLRPASLSQNGSNAKKSKRGSSSKFKGVSWYQDYQQWRATICIAGKQRHLGYFDTELEAALAYDKALVIKSGPYAATNDALGLLG